MISPTDFFKVGKVDEIREQGWIKVWLLGRQIVVFSYNDDFIAIELGGITDPRMKGFLMDDSQHYRSGAKRLVRKFLGAPGDSSWGRLKHFPVRIDDDSVFVGITY
jgi:nitrite reductase/ring-hydroxylating ferredoxin subunit